MLLLLLWAPSSGRNAEQDMNRFGTSLANTIANASAGHLLNRDRIELAVIANNAIASAEISGLIFYDASNRIIAMSGSNDEGERFIASAGMDDIPTGYVAVMLNPSAFALPARWGTWLLSLMVLVGVPFATLGILQLSTRGNRSLPIVSIPEPVPLQPQMSYCLTVNLHNQLALDLETRKQAINDAMAMAREVCAIHQGMALEVPLRGVVLMFDRKSVSAMQALCASLLLQHLLAQFETAGHFRCFLCETPCHGSPAELEEISLAQLQPEMDLNANMTLAALARSHTVILTDSIYRELGDAEYEWGRPFKHPLLGDMEEIGQLFVVEALPAGQQQLVESQGALILGFNQASAS
jgi:hypothetical protein